jgi:hypothetical protein
MAIYHASFWQSPSNYYTKLISSTGLMNTDTYEWN